MTLNELYVRIGVGIGQFSRGIDRATRQLNAFSDRVSNMSTRMRDAGEKMAKAITVPIAAAGVVMAKAASDFQNAQGKIQASLGITAKEAEGLSNISRDIWKEGFGQDMQEVTQALIGVKHNLADINNADLQKITQNAMTIAEVFDQDVNEVTKAVGIAMKNFGVNANEALDMITVGFQKNADFSGEFLDSISEYSVQFASMGLDMRDALNMIINTGDFGAYSADKISDALKELGIRAQDGSKTTAEGFAAIGLSADQISEKIALGGDEAKAAFTAIVTSLSAMEDPLAREQAGVALLGSTWEDLKHNAVSAMIDSKDSMTDFEGATKRASDALRENNPGLEIQKAFRGLQAAIAPALLPLADIINSSIVPAIERLSKWFKNLSPASQKAVVGIAGMLLLAGPLLFFIGSLASGFATVFKVISNFGNLLTRIPAAIAMLTNPIGIAIAIIGALVLAGIYLYRNWDEIKAKASEIWENIKSTISEKIETVKTKISQTWEGIKTSAITAWNNLKTGVVNAADSVRSSVTEKLSAAWDYIKSIPGQALQWGKDIISSLIQGLKSMKIPTPHFDFSVGTKTIGGVSFPVPNASVNWYKQGAIFDNPSIVGVGEAGREYLIPTSPGMRNRGLALWEQAGREMGVSPSKGQGNTTIHMHMDGAIKTQVITNDSDINEVASQATAIMVRQLRAILTNTA